MQSKAVIMVLIIFTSILAGCSGETDDTDTLVTVEDGPAEYNFTEMLNPMGALGSYDAQIGLDHNYLVIGDTIYFIQNDLMSFSFAKREIIREDTCSFENALNVLIFDGLVFFILSNLFSFWH